MKARTGLSTLVAVFVLPFVFSMSVLAGPPDPVKTKYLKTIGAGFNIDRSARALYYSMSYQILVDLRSPLYVSIRFQNPDNARKPFVKYTIFKPKQRAFRVESPPFNTIMNNHNYEVVVQLYGDKERKFLVGKHSQKVQFSVPERLLPGLGIEVIK